jgi:hypothetical protein
VAILEFQSTREKKADLLKKKKKNMKGTFYQFTLSSNCTRDEHANEYTIEAVQYA